MKTIISAIAGGKNILVLLAFALIGFFLVVTPNFETFESGSWFMPSVIAFGWNFLFAALITGVALLLSNEDEEQIASKTFFSPWVCGLAAVLGVLLH